MGDEFLGINEHEIQVSVFEKGKPHTFMYELDVECCETANSDASQQLTELCMSLYHDRADDFFRQYQSVAAEKVHASWLAVLDAMPVGHALDVGAGSGRDARYLAERGWSVVAVEPADALRERAMQLPVAGVTWLADSLPELGAVYRLQIKFDLIVLSAVWMHIAPSARARALRKLAGLLKPGGKLLFSEHGLAPDLPVVRWQNRITPLWKPLAGGCHLNRDIAALITAGGFQIRDIQSSYLKGPKPMTWVSRGWAD